MQAQYFVHLQILCTEKRAKLVALIQLFESIPPIEREQVSTEFYELYPVLKEKINVYERLRLYQERRISPDSGLILCLEEYFDLWLKSRDFDKI